jgi:uncharacterized protein (DUF849 family)
MEDVTVLPDGMPASSNAELVAAAARLIRGHARNSGQVDSATG